MSTMKLMLGADLDEDVKVLIRELISSMMEMQVEFTFGIPTRITIKAVIENGVLSIYRAGGCDILFCIRLESDFEGELPEFWTVYSLGDLRSGITTLLIDEAQPDDREGFYRELWLVRAFHRLGGNLADFEYYLPAGHLFEPTINPLVDRMMGYFIEVGFDVDTFFNRQNLRVIVIDPDNNDPDNVVYCDAAPDLAMNALFGCALQLEARKAARLGISPQPVEAYETILLELPETA